MKSNIYVIVVMLVLTLGLTACDPDNPDDPYYRDGPYDGGEYGDIYVDDFVDEYEDGYGNEETCGYLNEPCCQDLDHTDIYGNWQPIYYCNDDLDCRAEVCVESPDYQAYDRTDREYY